MHVLMLVLPYLLRCSFFSQNLCMAEYP